MKQYLGESQHGYWWLEYTGDLKYNKNCHGVKPEDFFAQWTCIKWWHVRCELDWYKMRKEYRQLADNHIAPRIA